MTPSSRHFDKKNNLLAAASSSSALPVRAPAAAGRWWVRLPSSCWVLGRASEPVAALLPFVMEIFSDVTEERNDGWGGFLVRSRSCGNYPADF